MFFLLLACNLLNPEKAGIYGCDQYCEKLIEKTQSCADEAGVSLDEFAGDADSDWKGKGKQEIIDSCNEKIKDKSETSCEAETGTFDNLSCDDILSTIKTLGGAS